ncbi:VOC family protein [Alkalihalobacillus sp. 1P02AB]|uniref:VOC family protein n=1 Tax=Alkalihalobacillus sp. 1P02AB TaxID=3132260 RepID=UPI0039A6D2C1
MLDRIDTICVTVSDLDNSLNWYADKLKLNVINREDDYAILKVGNSHVPFTIEVGEVKANASVYPIFFSSDLEKVHRQLRKQDVIVTDIVQVGANTFFDLFDLDGNRLQVCFC